MFRCYHDGFFAVCYGTAFIPLSLFGGLAGKSPPEHVHGCVQPLRVSYHLTKTASTTSGESSNVHRSWESTCEVGGMTRLPIERSATYAEAPDEQSAAFALLEYRLDPDKTHENISSSVPPLLPSPFFLLFSAPSNSPFCPSTSIEAQCHTALSLHHLATWTCRRH